jgi:hypothetical protein
MLIIVFGAGMAPNLRRSMHHRVSFLLKVEPQAVAVIAGASSRVPHSTD